MNLNIRPSIGQYDSNLEADQGFIHQGPPGGPSLIHENQFYSIQNTIYQQEKKERKEKNSKQENHSYEVEKSKNQPVYHKYLEGYLGGIYDLTIMLLDYCASSVCAKATSPELRKIWYERNQQKFANIDGFFHYGCFPDWESYSKRSRIEDPIANFDLFENIETRCIQISQFARTLVHLAGVDTPEERQYEDLDISYVMKYFRNPKLTTTFKKIAEDIDLRLWHVFEKAFNRIPKSIIYGEEEFDDLYERIGVSTKPWVKGANARCWLEEPAFEWPIKSIVELKDTIPDSMTVLPFEIRKLPYLRHIELNYKPLNRLSLNLKGHQIFQPLKCDLNKLKQHPNEDEGIEPELGNILATLNLGHNNFSIIPSEIFNLVNLKTLIFKDNQLADLPGDVDMLINLTVLSLSWNKLVTLPPEIGRLSNLQKLEVDHNQIQALPDTIGNLSNLRHLGLNNNRLLTLPETIGNLSILCHLGLNNNRLVSLPGTIGNLRSLLNLELNSNQLAALPSCIGNLTQLCTLSLVCQPNSESLITLPEEIGNLINLKKINIAGNTKLIIPLTLKTYIKTFKKNGGEFDIPYKELKKQYEKKEQTCSLQ